MSILTFKTTPNKECVAFVFAASFVVIVGNVLSNEIQTTKVRHTADLVDNPTPLAIKCSCRTMRFACI